MGVDGEMSNHKSGDIAEDATVPVPHRIYYCVTSVAVYQTHFLVCLADHNLPHPLLIPPLEGEEIIKLALMPLGGEG